MHDHDYLLRGEIGKVSPFGRDEASAYCDKSFTNRAICARRGTYPPALMATAHLIAGNLSRAPDRSTPADKRLLFTRLRAWQLAHEYAPNDARREIMQDLLQANPLEAPIRLQRKIIAKYDALKSACDRPLNDAAQAKAVAKRHGIASPLHAAWQAAATSACVPTVLTMFAAGYCLTTSFDSLEGALAMIGTGIIATAGYAGGVKAYHARVRHLNIAEFLGATQNLLARTKIMIDIHRRESSLGHADAGRKKSLRL